MTMTRRQLVGLGATGVAGAVVGRAALDPASAAKPALGGLHIHVTTNQVSPPPPTDGFIHTFVVTLWGPDEDMSGFGGGFTIGTPVQNLVGTGFVGCVLAAWGAIENDVLEATGVMIYSGMPDDKMGTPFPIEANLATGFCRFIDMNMGMGSEVVVEGTGRVTRI